jgi:hypothetical protein
MLDLVWNFIDMTAIINMFTVYLVSWAMLWGSMGKVVVILEYHSTSSELHMKLKTQLGPTYSILRWSLRRETECGKTNQNIQKLYILELL